MGKFRIDESKCAALIGAIYEAAADFDRWPNTLRLIAEAYGARAAVMTRQGESPDQSKSIAPLCERTYFESYARHYHGANPIWRRAASAPTGTAQTDCMVMPKDEFVRMVADFVNITIEHERLIFDLALAPRLKSSVFDEDVILFAQSPNTVKYWRLTKSVNC